MTSLADSLRARPDAELTTLLRLRRDLATPPPRDIDVLATRAGTAASVARACADLDTRTLGVFTALLVDEADSVPVPAERVAQLTGIDPTMELEQLRGRALAWDDASGVLIVPAATEALGQHPAGLGDSLPQLRETTADSLQETLDELRADERELLDTLAAGPPIGTTRDADPTAFGEEPHTPVQRLLARGLLLHRDNATVELPRELGIAARGGRVFRDGALDEPAPELVSHEQDTVDTTAAGEAMEFVRHTEALLRSLSVSPIPVLKAGGLGIREARRLAKELELDERNTTLLLEVAAAAGLIAADGSATPEWMPTTLMDSWLACPTAVRWTMLAEAWLPATRQPYLAGTKDHKDKTLVPLSPELAHPGAPAARHRMLDTLAEYPAGTGLRDPDDLVTLLSWRQPRRAGAPAREATRAGLLEARKLGLLALGTLSSPARALLEQDRATAIDNMAAALPTPVDHVLVQADLTVVAPGPLEPELGGEIDAVADVESTGHATVYRVTESSVRRALDTGRTSDELHELFRKYSATPVPQGLTYLINDVARRHGRLRGGAASSFLRCDDEVLLTELMAAQENRNWDLRRIAPTVVVSSRPLAELLDELRGAGFSPIAEGPDGNIIDLTRDRGQRTAATVRPPEYPTSEPAPASSERAAAVVERIRAAERAASSVRGDAVRPAPGSGSADTAATLSLLNRASREGREVWIGFVDSHGTADQRIVTPARVGGGMLQGANNERYPLHRITSAAMVEDR